MRLGIDTGGCFTDAVLIDADGSLFACGKAETRHGELERSIIEAASPLLDRLADPGRLSLVGLSTTLATNAIVEGRGSHALLILVGFGPELLSRAGLRKALAGDPVLYLPGGHDACGRPRAPLDVDAALAEVARLRERVEAVAIVGAFAVRNPSHEIELRNRIRESFGLPVTCSHELSAELDAARRALTTLFNARLVPPIGALMEAAEGFLRQRGVRAPLMIVRGDGGLMLAETARERPVETVLSGPAASAIGARWLAPFEDALVADMGGTTTDILLIERGRPRISPHGARIGSYRTMIRAVEVETVALGGDSAVRREKRGLRLGPERRIPLSHLARRQPAILDELKRQAAAPSREHDAQFAVAVAPPSRFGRGERHLWELLEGKAVAVERIAERPQLAAALSRLEKRGAVRRAGFTPTDAAHVLGHLQTGSLEAARLGALLEARRTVAEGGGGDEPVELFARQVFEACEEAFARALVGSTLRWMGERPAWLDAALEGSTLPRALHPSPAPPDPNLLELRARLMRPVIGAGAPAPLFFPRPAGHLDALLLIPEAHAVCNAIGAVVGEVVWRTTITVTRGEKGAYHVHGEGEPRTCRSLEEALRLAEGMAREQAMRRARQAGAEEVSVRLERQRIEPAVGGSKDPMVLEVRVTAVATGRPSVAGD